MAGIKKIPFWDEGVSFFKKTAEKILSDSLMLTDTSDNHDLAHKEA